MDFNTAIYLSGQGNLSRENFQMRVGCQLLMYDFRVLTIEAIILFKWLETSSVGQLQAETMGRHVLGLWILGKK